jgi:hypothetical protein
MIVGAVAQVLEDVIALGERRLADPVRALPAYARIPSGTTVEELCGQPEQK